MLSYLPLESVFHGRDNELLPKLFSFYAPDSVEIRDVTANRRKMWKNFSLPGKHIIFSDIDPDVNPDRVCSWDNLSEKDNSIDVILFDPPHLPLAAASEKSLVQYKQDYGLEQSIQADNIEGMFDSFLCEAHRVLVPDGLIFAKIKDYIHNHHYQWNLAVFCEYARKYNFTPCDLIIKIDPCGGNLKSGRWENSYHVRNIHCYWLIIRKGKCEPRKVHTR